MGKLNDINCTINKKGGFFDRRNIKTINTRAPGGEPKGGGSGGGGANCDMSNSYCCAICHTWCKANN
jgi:hypothetical protein